MALREDKMGQTWLVPRSVTDFIPEDHICHLVIALVDSLDVDVVEEKYRGTRGKPAYSRRMLLRLLLMAYLDGVFSSRKIARIAQENVVYMYLTGMETPDFRTICNFKIECKVLIAQAFLETVHFAKSQGMVKLGHISIDGTKIKANASNNHTITGEELKLIKKLIMKGIDVDIEEDELYGDERGDQLPPGLARREKIREVLEELKKETEGAGGGKLRKAGEKLVEQYIYGDEGEKQEILNKIIKAEEELQKSGQDAVSLSDPDSRFMKNKKNHTELSYNYQITVDHESGIIVAGSVSQDPTDDYQLQPQIEHVEENVGKLPPDTKVSSDNGYFNGKNLRYLEGREFDGYIPNKKQASLMKGKGKDKPYSKDKFLYDPQRDVFTCPVGELLTRKGIYTNKNTGKKTYAYYGANCKECQAQIECAGNKMRKKVITSNEYEPERQRMARKMETKEAKMEYGKRKIVEHPFGNIKYNMRYTEFLTRGISKVGIEQDLVNVSHNLKRIWNKIDKTIIKITETIQKHIHKSPTASVSI